MLMRPGMPVNDGDDDGVLLMTMASCKVQSPMLSSVTCVTCDGFGMCLGRGQWCLELINAGAVPDARSDPMSTTLKLQTLRPRTLNPKP